jgi:hypothetical protein
MGRVPVAFLGTGKAGRCTGINRCAEESEIWRGLPRHDAASGVAGVGAIEVEANAADQLLQIVLAQTGVGAGGAAGGAVEALLDTAQERLAIEVRWLWV